ncbi:hypothetical protein [Paenibacillus sp. MMO-58]|uniref:hypothetical protein n=1 Tax=Paenibacillus sp. MMO-58 TaxID=3081290 RepID=UPI003019DB01
MLSTIMSYGIYLGEVFVRNVAGAEWQQETENFMDWNFKISRENHIFIGYPMKRVRSYWFDRTNTLYSYFQMNMDALNGKLKMKESSQWIDQEGQYRYRFSRNYKRKVRDHAIYKSKRSSKSTENLSYGFK